jgi:hypothetical protein
VFGARSPRAPGTSNFDETENANAFVFPRSRLLIEKTQPFAQQRERAVRAATRVALPPARLATVYRFGPASKRTA